MAAKRYYYCADGTNVVGPFSRPETRKLLTAKIIFPETVISTGGDEWKPARFFPELLSAMSHLEQPPPLPKPVAGPRRQPVPDWHADPPTDRQIARLEFLGVKLPVNVTKGVASEMLDRIITPENQIAWDKHKAKTIDRVHSRFLAFCYSVIPGAGHYYSGAQFAAVAWLVAVAVAYYNFFYVGVGLHILCACCAAAPE